MVDFRFRTEHKILMLKVERYCLMKIRRKKKLEKIKIEIEISGSAKKQKKKDKTEQKLMHKNC
jgi:hypothetical protein